MGEVARDAHRAICERIDRSRLPARRLRVGIDAPAHIASLICAGSGLPFRVVAVQPGDDDARDCAGLGLDAILRQPRPGTLRIGTLERPGLEAAWDDWAGTRPLSYGSVFPNRIDPARITLVDEQTLDRDDIELVRALAASAASLARTPARLSLRDRLLGRRIVSRGRALSRADHCMLWLTRIVMDRAGEMPATCSLKSAARAVSAWLATTDAWVQMRVRRRGIEAAGVVLGDEPEVLLRMAGARFATMDDEGGHWALVLAHRAIRQRGARAATDPMLFLEAELSLGGGGMALGRVAAGICLACATGEPGCAAFVRDDLAEEMNYSEWLVGRDQDRALLLEVCRVMERQEGGAVRLAA